VLVCGRIQQRGNLGFVAGFDLEDPAAFIRLAVDQLRESLSASLTATISPLTGA
jgi:hypothetical protein